MTRVFLERTRTALGNLGVTGRKLGGGGAGTVYAHDALPRDTCVKLYESLDVADQHAEKLAVMIRQTPRDVWVATERTKTVQLAWPIDRVVDEHGRVTGFAMPLIDTSNAWTGSQVVNPRLRTRNMIPQGQRIGLAVALNTANVMQSLHDAGHYVIDLKPGNFFVYNRKIPARAGFVAMVDCDGFSVFDRQTDHLHPAELNSLEYSHPRAHPPGVGRQWVKDHPLQQDLWTAAVLFFKLLNGTLHPMSGVPRTGRNVPSSEVEKMSNAARYYPYGREESVELAPSPGSIHRWMSDELREMFDETFMHERPPSLRRWRAEFERLNEKLQFCPNDPNHWKIGPGCGHCDIQAGREPPEPAPPQQIAIPISTMGTVTGETPAARSLGIPAISWVGPALLDTLQGAAGAGWGRTMLKTIALPLAVYALAGLALLRLGVWNQYAPFLYLLVAVCGGGAILRIVTARGHGWIGRFALTVGLLGGLLTGQALVFDTVDGMEPGRSPVQAILAPRWMSGLVTATGCRVAAFAPVPDRLLMRVQAIATLQRTLNAMGEGPIPVDGRLETRTREAYAQAAGRILLADDAAPGPDATGICRAVMSLRLGSFIANIMR